MKIMLQDKGTIYWGRLEAFKKMKETKIIIAAL